MLVDESFGPDLLFAYILAILPKKKVLLVIILLLLLFIPLLHSIQKSFIWVEDF